MWKTKDKTGCESEGFLVVVIFNGTQCHSHNGIAQGQGDLFSLIDEQNIGFEGIKTLIN